MITLRFLAVVAFGVLVGVMGLALTTDRGVWLLVIAVLMSVPFIVTVSVYSWFIRRRKLRNGSS